MFIFPQQLSSVMKDNDIVLFMQKNSVYHAELRSLLYSENVVGLLELDIRSVCNSKCIEYEKRKFTTTQRIFNSKFCSQPHLGEIINLCFCQGKFQEFVIVIHTYLFKHHYDLLTESVAPFQAMFTMPPIPNGKK